MDQLSPETSVARAAEELAASHLVAQTLPTPIPAWQHIDKAESWLHDVRLAATNPTPEMGKAAEWLLDNDYQIHRAIRQVEEGMPEEFYNRLPALVRSRGYPRIFAIAHELLHQTHLQLSIASAVRFVNDYQRIAPLTIAELWALPAMLRIACIEILVASMSPLLEKKLQWPFEPTRWALRPAALDETERVARAISNLALIAAIPWEDVFDRVSLVEAELGEDPAGFYDHMDFESRDRYRRAVEEIAMWSGKGELDVAQTVVRWSRHHGNDLLAAHHHGGHVPLVDPSLVECHVGYWLADAGRAELEQALGAEPPAKVRALRFVRRRPLLIYHGLLALCLLGTLALPAMLLWVGHAGPGMFVAGMALSLLPASVLAVLFVQWVLSLLLPVATVNKLDLDKGLTLSTRTVVAVPAMAGSVADAESLLEQLETHWLANTDAQLQLALLADPPDADAETLPADAAVRDALVEGIAALNRRYRDPHGDGPGPFHLLMRPRLWNPSQGKWMAWERKRGKIEQFNRFLLTGDRAPFSVVAGEGRLADMRFVVTVDADTLLPPGSVRRLAGTLAHPLNRARFDADGRVTAGYTVLQPRVEIAPQSGARTLFARIWSGDTAIDIYSRAVSDTYQDLFGAGIYVGKGIYDLAAFDRATHGRVPENAILSHDLFEGAHGRAALVTDIVLYEHFPSGYVEHLRRLHRWIRGDWQLLPWLRRRVPGADGERLPSLLSAIDRLKIADNLRRSLIAPSLVLLAVAGWLFLPGSPLGWTLLVVFGVAGAFFIDFAMRVASRKETAAQSLLEEMRGSFLRWISTLVFLLQDALLALSAIGTTLKRLWFTKRGLLDWTTAAQTAARFGGAMPPSAYWRLLWAGPAVALGIGLVVALLRPAVLPAALLLLVPWFLAPQLAWFISRPARPEEQPLGMEERRFLRLIARRTWLWFETFAGPGDNWLPPDNHQGAPFEATAHRTSPTNIGMLLLSAVSAYDFGWMGRQELAAWAGNVLDTLDRMERHRGHWLNWVDTRTLHTLEPRYISVVDSGNLAGALLALAAALDEAAEAPPLLPERWRGLDDVLHLLREAVGALPAAEGLRPVLDNLAQRLAALEHEPMAWPDALQELAEVEIPSIETRAAAMLVEGAGLGASALEPLRDLRAWLGRLRHQVTDMARDLRQPAHADYLHALARRAVGMADAMEFGPFYDQSRRLFFIGHNISFNKTDPNHYDLLASEARLASVFAIAKGDVPLEHWFHLGRPVTRVAGGLSLMSWSGSMFEYLMPRMLLKPAPGTLLAESERLSVAAQEAWGTKNGVPWGISESGFAARDPAQNFRYQAFGVPGLGIKRGLARDLVIAPYASGLSLMVAPRAAAANLRAMWEKGFGNRFGMYEAIDYTHERQVGLTQYQIVNSHMSHHQGMLLVSAGNALHGDRMVQRFAADPRMRFAGLLLSERIPRDIPQEIERLEAVDRAGARAAPVRPLHSWRPEPAPTPALLLLGNGQLSSWVSDAGAGAIRWRGKALNRFVADAARDADGLFVYLHDEDTGALWSATRQPTGSPADEVHTVFHAHMAEFHRRANGIASRLDVAVVAGDDIEIRRVQLVNESDRPRRIRVTSAAEVALAGPIDDERHPAFSKLFVFSEYLREAGGLLFTRKPRTHKETPPVLLHRLLGPDGPVPDALHEGDRRAFLGRGRNFRDPAGARAPLSGAVGTTLDPVMALQQLIELEPQGRATLAFVTIAGASRETVIEVAERHATLAALEWSLSEARSEAARSADRLKIDPGLLPRLHGLAAHLVYPTGALRADEALIRDNRFGQHHLWALGISGDLPILVLRMEAKEESPLLGELICGHQLWHRHGVDVDLVILKTAGSTYFEPVREEMAAQLREAGAGDIIGRRGGVHLLFSDQIQPEQVRHLLATARVVLDGAKPLDAQMAQAGRQPQLPPPFTPSLPVVAEPETARAEEPLLFWNGHGGMTQDGREYVIRVDRDHPTPTPWVNVMANRLFGTLATETGGGFSWGINSGENRLTPWTNDPVSDRPGEILYLRDEETAAIWTPTPLPAGGPARFEVRHGTGITRWLSSAHGFDQELAVFVPPDQPVKIARVTLRNLHDRHRRVTATYYAEWLLGALASIARPNVVCSLDPATRSILATSHWNSEFAGRTAFLAASRDVHGLTADRMEFLGREADLARPAGLARWGLSGRVAAGADPCAAIQMHIDLPPGAEESFFFVLGEGEDAADAARLAAEWRDPARVAAAEAELHADWEALLGHVQVETPDKAFDIMVNRWLIGQTLSSRILARAGFYQASGAIGFRDQLQDVLGLLHSQPWRARAHILDCASHQFEQGDVQHWWHPPGGRGVRTRFSDDLVWLALGTATYVEATGDTGILDEKVPFLTAPELGPDEEDRYAAFPHTEQAFPLLDHVERALERAWTQGPHGLPLIGTGDWNDGMDRLGRAGRGESVWLAWFLIVTARKVAVMERRIGRDWMAQKYERQADALLERTEAAAWDGGWYRRAYDDVGHPIGSADNEECRIDSISQSWSLFAGADAGRTAQALAAAERELVQDNLARLLWPPFDKTPLDPGYIRSYPPGVRENGGQYSHAATWLGLAHVQAGDGDAARRIFAMLNPLERAADAEGAARYRGEPYALAGDILSGPEFVGRAGWTWYTGASSWTWRLGVEGILGIRLAEGGVTIDPCLPKGWKGYAATLRRADGAIRIEVRDPEGLGRGVTRIEAGGLLAEGPIAFPTDGSTLEVVVRMG